MAENTKIEWTRRPGTVGSTMNALVGCQKVSKGCQHCYAINVAHVRGGNPMPVMQQKFAGTTIIQGGRPNWSGKVTFTEKALFEPLAKKKPRTYFINALSDLFYEGVSDEVIGYHHAVAALCPQHTFICLTKRAQRMLNHHKGDWKYRALWALQRILDRGLITHTQRGEALSRILGGICLPNWWQGVSIEDQQTADERIAYLLSCDFAVRLVSYEPGVGGVDLHNLDAHALSRAQGHTPDEEELGEPWKYSALAAGDLYWGGSGGISDGPEHGALDWVIVGGESEARKGEARLFNIGWARQIVKQCADAGVACFVKQLGAKPYSDELGALTLTHPKGGDWNEWPEDLRVRQFPEVRP